MKTIDEALARAGREVRDAADRRGVPAWDRSGRRPVVRIAWAAGLLGVVVAVGAWWSMVVEREELAGMEVPGTWQTMAAAPIGPRPHAVSAWTGDEAVFWAGASLDRGFAHTDGAAYDPDTNEWHRIAVPGWGHPGLEGVYFDGAIYAVAKGGGTRFEPSTGEWSRLPAMDNLVLSAIVATDDAVWGLGPTVMDSGGSVGIAAARFDRALDRWVPGPAEPQTQDVGSPFGDDPFGIHPVLWTGTEIVAWNTDAGHGAAFDPARKVWRRVGPSDPAFGTVVDSVAVVADGVLVIVAEVQSGGASNIAMAVDGLDGWRWYELGIGVEDFDSLTVAAASDWIVLFQPDSEPVTVEVATGFSVRHAEGPLAGISAPNTVWTGEQLIVWGGVGSATTAVPAPVEGAVWTPPAG